MRRERLLCRVGCLVSTATVWLLMTGVAWADVQVPHDGPASTIQWIAGAGFIVVAVAGVAAFTLWRLGQRREIRHLEPESGDEEGS